MKRGGMKRKEIIIMIYYFVSLSFSLCVFVDAGFHFGGTTGEIVYVILPSIRVHVWIHPSVL